MRATSITIEGDVTPNDVVVPVWTINGDMTVGDTANGSVTIDGADSGIQIFGEDFSVFIGKNAGVEGTGSVLNGGGWVNGGGTMYVGYFGEGTLNLSNDAAVWGLGLEVGYYGGSSGTVLVSNSELAHTYLGVGTGGSATLTITDGGEVGSAFMKIGSSASGHALVNVVDGTLTTHGNSEIGKGSLEIGTNGSVVHNSQFVIGWISGQTGTVELNGGSWTVNSVVDIGQVGNGTVEITDGEAFVSSARVGYLPGATGTIKMSGGTYTTDPDAASSRLTLGYAGNGRLELSGGTFHSAYTQLGVFGGSGEIDITGGSFSNVGRLSVGHYGFGTFNISGGSATTDSMTFGVVGGGGTLMLSGGVLTTGQLDKGDGTAMAMIDGGTLRLSGNQTALFENFEPGSVTLGAMGAMIDTQSFEVATALGLTGPGGLRKQGAGSLTLTGNNSYEGATVLRNGTLRVNGGGQMGHSASSVTVGDLAGDNAMLDIGIGGTVIANQGIIGLQTGSTGLAEVTGGIWDNTGLLLVGGSGNGTLEISAGEVLNSSAAIASSANSTGLARVSGGLWNNSNNISVGVSGNGTLEITGGEVRNQSATIGGETTGTGIARVSGGLWNNTNNLTVGSSGTGTLEISGSGEVRAVTTTVGSNNDGNGTLNLLGGVLLTGQLREGTGTGTVAINLGTLRLTGNQTQLFDGFEDGDVSLAGLGGFIDVQEFEVSSAAGIGGDGTLFKQGTGTLTLTGNNTYAGGTSVRSGTLKVSGNGSISHASSGISIGANPGDNGTLQVFGDGSVTTSIGSIGAVAGSTGSAWLVGGSWINSGSLAVGGAGNGTLELGFDSNVAADIVSVASGASGTGTLYLFGGTLTATQVQEGSGSGSVVLNGGILQLAANQSALFQGFEAGDVTLAGTGGTIDTNGFSVASGYGLGGSGSLTKAGTGVLTLSGNNTYAGPTTVTAGTLVVNGTLTSSDLTISSGGTLRGSGTLEDILLEAGGTLAPGNSIGTLSGDSFTWNAGGDLFYELGDGTADLLSLGGALTMTGIGEFLFTFQNAGWGVGQTYTLIEFTNSNFSSGDFGFTNTGGFDGYFTLASDSLSFTLVAIPEPRIGSLLLIAVAIFASRKLKPRRRKMAGTCPS